MYAATASATAGARASGGTWTREATWSRRAVAALLAAVVLLSTASPATATARAAMAASGDLVEVVVTRAAGAEGAAERLVDRLGGRILDRLDIVGGFSAEVPAGAVDVLRSSPAVDGVADNRQIQLYGRRMTGDALRGSSTLGHVREVVGADVGERFGVDGSGVGIAVVDTGVTAVEGLSSAGKVSHGPDITSESGDPATATKDSYGHGTHLAGIAAGRDAGASGEFRGVASEARVVSVKAAPRDGTTDLLRVLAALDWVGQFKDEAGIKVLNLSFGAPNAGDYRSDPLAVAVERLWESGIVVVVAGGNEGEREGSPITSPGTDPYVITVGAVDTKGTPSRGDDQISSFSPRGSAARRVDLVAPGQSIVSLRTPGSHADENFGTARVGDRFFKGTGTSQATAIVAGVVASLLEARPDLTPDEVKAVLKASASRVPSASAAGQGSGMVDLVRALGTPVPADATQSWPEAALPPAPPPGDAPPPPCPPPAPAGEEPPAEEAEPEVEETCSDDWAGGSWTGGSWTGGSWTGGSWTGGSWTTADGTWSGGSWTGGSWTGGSWTGGSWTGLTFTGGSWTGGSWTGGSWTGGSWTGGSWTGGSWTGGSWTGGSWTGGSWTGGSWTGDVWAGGPLDVGRSA